jgi:hexosaminidase
LNQPTLIPKPVIYQPGSGKFVIQPETPILVSGEFMPAAQILRKMLAPATGYPLNVDIASQEKAKADSIRLANAEPSMNIPREGYELVISEKGIVLHASDLAGAFNGVQTLRQLLPEEIENRTIARDVEWSLPATRIVDYPRFSWRGLHLDVGRHFFPVEFIKRYIDLLALHKMNTFHWHLTEDQGWRIEIKKYPRLTEVGAWRAATPLPANRETLDGVPYGGFYTQDEVREVVAFAASRGVTIVPEIEMPGHSTAALASYPHLGCTGGPYQVRTWWGIEDDVYCAGNDQVFEFLEDVLGEVLDLFPSPFIHIGGDECPKVRWKECPKCQQRIQAEGLKDEDELQSYFIRRIERFLDTQGRRLIGWDEILEGGLAPGATVMSWRGIEGGIQAAQAGHDVVMSPYSHCYFDYHQSENTEGEPPAIGGFLPLEMVYTYEPVPDALDGEQAKHVLGAQGNVWTEFIPTSELVEYMTYPRATALAEVTWSSPDGRDFAEFSQRLVPFLHRLDRLGVNYRKP